MTLMTKLRQMLERHGIHLSTNWNADDKDGRVSLIDHSGNAWVHLTFGVRQPTGVSAHVTVRGEDRIVAYLGIHFVWVAIASEVMGPAHGAHREIGLSLSWGEDTGSPFLHWRLWRDPYVSKSRDWREGGWWPVDTLLGRYQHSEREIKPWTDIVIPMPEGTYPAKARLRDGVWKRPRWPWPKVVRSVEIKVERGIGIPGKGENSWDCDDDAIFGMSTRARTIEDGIGNYVASALRTRMRRQGHHGWKREAAA